MYFQQRIDLQFASSDEAHHVAAALVSLYQSMVIYPCHELTTNELLAPPSVVKLKKSGYHGPLRSADFVLFEVCSLFFALITCSRSVGIYLWFERSVHKYLV